MKEFFNESRLGIRDLQAFHESLDREKGFDSDILRNVAYLAEEIGEVVSAIRDLRESDNPSAVDAARTRLGEELADCLAYILKLANYAGIDLQEAYVKKMERNLIRTWQKRRGAT